MLTTLYPDLRAPDAARSGVYAPQHDSMLLIEAMQQTNAVRGRAVLDLCTGSGVVAIAAARLGARHVTAYDICPEAVRCARGNAAATDVVVDTRLGTLESALRSGPYDLVVSNPPYVPTGPDAHLEEIPGAVGPAWAWNAGIDGRLVLDPMCDAAPALLDEEGTMLIVQSEFADADQTVRRLRRRGLRVDVLMTQLIPFGPVLHARATWLEGNGRLPVGRREEELIVIRAQK